MKANLKIWAVIFTIVAAGMLITQFTRGYVSRQTAQYAAGSAGLEETAAAASQASEVESFSLAGSDGAAGLEARKMPDKIAEEGGSVGAEPSGLSDTEGEELSSEGTEAVPDAAASAPVPFLAQAEPEAEGFSSESDSAEITEEASGEAALASPAPAAAMIPQETAAESAAAETEEPSVSLRSAQAPEESAETEDYRTQLARIQERLVQVEAQIARIRSSDTDSNVYNVKNLAQSELKIWERELDAVYDLLMDSLPEEEAEELKKEQQSWLEKASNDAREAASKKSGGSMESVEYTAAMAEAARARVYELLELYGG